MTQEKFHYTGVPYDPTRPKSLTKFLKKDILKNSAAYRAAADWTAVQKFAWVDVWRGCLEKAVLPVDAFKAISVVLGAFVSEVCQTKQRDYEADRGHLVQVSVPGDLEAR